MKKVAFAGMIGLHHVGFVIVQDFFVTAVCCIRLQNPERMDRLSKWRFIMQGLFKR